jgi:Tfp pilus assembly protein PilO
MLTDRSAQSTNVDIVGEAYHIAADYLQQVGLIPVIINLYEPLLEKIMKDFSAGDRNKVRLANRAIAYFERVSPP